MAIGWEGSEQDARTFLNRAHRMALADGRVEDADAIRAEAYAPRDAHCGYCHQWGHDCNAGDVCPMEPTEPMDERIEP